MPKPRTHSKPKRVAAPPARLPTKAEILDFIREAGEKVGKREIARAFNIKGQDRIELKRLLAEMSREGLIAGNRREMRKKGGLPPAFAVLEIVARDDDGELIAEPLSWDTDARATVPRTHRLARSLTCPRPGGPRHRRSRPRPHRAARDRRRG